MATTCAMAKFRLLGFGAVIFFLVSAVELNSRHNLFSAGCLVIGRALGVAAYSVRKC